MKRNIFFKIKYGRNNFYFPYTPPHPPHSGDTNLAKWLVGGLGHRAIDMYIPDVLICHMRACILKYTWSILCASTSN